MSVVHDAFKTFDEEFNKVLAHGDNGNPVKVPCCKGCSSCCYEPVYIERREAELLAKHILNLPEPLYQEARRRLMEWIRAMLVTGFINQELPQAIPYRLCHLACPLLDGVECRVYDERPISCRQHVALLNRAYCDNENLRPNQKYCMNQNGMGESLQMLMEDGGRLEFGHMNELLCELVLGIRFETASRQMVLLTK